MQKIRVDLAERSYNIAVGRGMLADIGKALEKFEFSGRVALVSNPTVYGLYGKTVSQSILDSGFELTEIIIPDGEEFKNLAWVEKIYGELLKSRLDRRSALLALGGGVIGDITGFAASTYMRGIDFVQVPTTLLAQVDSSVGGKTGVNHPMGKNMIGSFWQPRLVWADTGTLKSLPDRQYLAGIAEVIKYGVIWDEEFFVFLEENRDKLLGLEDVSVAHIVRRSCEIKAEVVSRDERESGLRAILNYGHTIGHAIETAGGYGKHLHGEAVAIGMCLEARLAVAKGLIGAKESGRIESLVRSYGLPFELPADIDSTVLFPFMELDKKTVGGELRFVLPEGIGRVRIQGGIAREEVERIM
jgi:3-dehydroquinate synthase